MARRGRGGGSRDKGWRTRDTTNEGFTPHSDQATKGVCKYELIAVEATQVKIWQGAGLFGDEVGLQSKASCFAVRSFSAQAVHANLVRAFACARVHS